MAKLNINGKSVTVDDSFLKLSPDEQNATVDEIAKTLGAAPPPNPSPSASPAPLAPPALATAPAPAYDAMGNATGGEMAVPAPSQMPYPDQMSNAGHAIDSGVRMLANGIPFMDRFSAAVHGGNYDENLAAERARDAEIRKASPVASTVANVVGGAALPVGALMTAAKGANMLGKMGYGALTGGAFGAAQGASDSPDLTNVTDTAKHAGTGAAIGAALGGVLPPVAQGIGAGARFVSNLVSSPVEGLGRPSTALLAEALRNEPRATANLSKLGDDAVLADSGPSLLALAQGVATKPGEGRSAMVNALTQRNEGTNSRILQSADDALGPAASPRTVQGDIKGQRSDVHADLPAIFEDAPPVDITPTLAMIGQKMNTAVGPEAAALGKIKDYLTTMRMGKTGPVLSPVDRAEKLQNAKSAIDLMIDYGAPEIGIVPGAISREQGAIADVRKSLNQQLREQVPGYSDVMDKSSALARKSDAVTEGGDILSSGKDTLWPEDLRKVLSSAEPGQVEGMQAGARGEVARLLGTKVNDLQALKTALQGDGGWNHQKLADLFGERNAQKLADSVTSEAKFRDTFNKVVENSQTAPRTAANKAIDEQTTTKAFVPKDATIIGLLGNAGEAIVRKGANMATNAAGDKARQELARALLMGPGPQRQSLLLSLGQRGEGGAGVGNPSAATIGALLNYNARQRDQSAR